MSRRGRRTRPTQPSQRPAERRRPRWPILAALATVGLGIGVWLAATTGWPRLLPAAGKLNVLLITLDTTRADYLGCYGRTAARTPNLDRLAASGARFERCTTCTPFTLPSHASILTALYPYVHGARYNASDRLAEGNLTLAEALKKAGYRTQATVASVVLNRKWGTAQGFDVYHDLTQTALASADELHAERRGDVVCDDALEMLSSLADGPFFLWVHFYDPHYPYVSARVADHDSPAAYEDEIAFMDVQIGRLLDGLKRLGLDRNTLVVVVGDHGEGLSEHGELLHGTFLYESTLHVPLIMACPGRIKGGQILGAQVRTIDVAPTILELLGCPAWEQAQGVSLVPLLKGQTLDLGLEAYAESLDGQVLFGLSMLPSLTQAGWKYVLAPKAELYELASDPGEMRNRLSDAPSVAEHIRERLREIIADSPPPPPKDTALAALTAADTAALESLGYVGHTVTATLDESTELDRFEPRGGDPKDYVRLFELKARAGGALRDQDFPRAEQMLRELVATMPNVSSLRVDLARALRGQGRLGEADEVYRQAAAMAPDNRLVRHAYGRFLLYEANQPAQAVTQLRAALDRSPDDVTILHDLGVALLTIGQVGSAEQYLQRAYTLQPASPQLTQAMGTLRLKQNRIPEAAEFFRQTLKLDPNSVEARRALDWVRQRAKPPVHGGSVPESH